MTFYRISLNTFEYIFQSHLVTPSFFVRYEKTDLMTSLEHKRRCPMSHATEVGLSYFVTIKWLKFLFYPLTH